MSREGAAPETVAVPSSGLSATHLDDLLAKTSRTFALSIPLLPEPTRREVGIAYLLFRIADTLEDAESWPPARQVAALETFAELLESADPDAPARPTAEDLAAEWLVEPPVDHAGYLELLAATPAVVAACQELEPAARRLIAHHTRRTALGMARFVARRGEGGPLVIRDLSDLSEYCYVVAGIVGEMLTELFLTGREGLQPAAADLRRKAARFGEALQLVNILKDSAGDADHGRRFLPAGVGREEVFALARRDLEAAISYVRRLQEAGAPRGIVAFTALPVRMASLALDRVEQHGPGAKLTRPEVFQVLASLNHALDTGAPAA